MCMPPLFAPPQRLEEPIPSLPPFFPPPEISSFWGTSIAITPSGTQKILPTPAGRKYLTGSSLLTSSPSMTLTPPPFSIAPLAVASLLTSPLLLLLLLFLAPGRCFRTWVLTIYQFFYPSLSLWSFAPTSVPLPSIFRKLAGMALPLTVLQQRNTRLFLFPLLLLSLPLWRWMRPNLPFLSAASNALLKPGGLLRWNKRLVKDARLLLPLTEVMKISRLTSLLLDAPRQSLPRPRLRHGRRLALLSHLGLSLPPCFARWTQSFLSDRRASVVFQNHKSRFFRVGRGVPQGSVLGPVLFSLFINDLPASLPSSVSCSLYADDLAIWSSSPSVPTAVEATQGALFPLEHWSEYWCLPLNPSKCEASFSVDPHQANLQPNLLLLGSRLRFNPTPTFLRVTFDRTLSFSKHVSSLKAKFFPRLKALRCISASSWGPSKESLSVLYKSFIRRFTRMISFSKRYQCHQIGTPPPSGQSRHHRLPLVLPYPSTTHWGFSTSSTSHSDSLYSFFLWAGPSSPNLLSYFRFGQTWSKTKTLQIVLESFCVHSPAHASFYLL